MAYPLAYLFKFFNITDYRMKLFITHLTIFIIPAIIYLLLSKILLIKSKEKIK